jgi:hypothetical protein
VLAVLPIVLLAIGRFIQLTFWPHPASAGMREASFGKT